MRRERGGGRGTHVPQAQLAVERAREEEAVVLGVERDARDKVEVLERAQALVARDVPQADRLVHRRRQEEVVLLEGRKDVQERVSEVCARRSGSTNKSRTQRRTLLQLRSSTSASCPLNSCTGLLANTGIVNGASLTFLPLAAPFEGVAPGRALDGESGEGEKARSGADDGSSTASRASGVERTSQTASGVRRVSARPAQHAEKGEGARERETHLARRRPCRRQRGTARPR